MDLRFTKEEEEFRRELCQFLEKEAELIKEAKKEYGDGIGWGPYTWELVRKLGARGYLTPHWPKKYGGLEKSYMERQILLDEMQYRAGSSGFGVGTGLAGPVLMAAGSEAQKDYWLPRIARGEIEFALGYTEPEAGSDLAALQMRAVKKGDHYVINGQKVFNTACHYAQYHWLAVRTDPTAGKHRGISMFIVDLSSPGITINPMIAMGGRRTNEVFYDDVKVPVKNLVGEENKGWYYLMTALNFERNWSASEDLHTFEELLDYVREESQNGRLLIDDPLIRRDLAQMAIELDIVRLFGLRIATMVSKGTVPAYEASEAKLFGSELRYRMFDRWIRVLSFYGQLDADSEFAINGGEIMQHYFKSIEQIITRGTSDIQRNIIAYQGCGLPRK